MPELPEVEITRRKLRLLVRGRQILGFWTDWPRGLRTAKNKKQIAKSIRGRKILDITRRGKVIFVQLSGRPERLMAIHLRMSGRLEVAKVTKETKGTKDLRWTHFVWRLSGGRELRFVDPRKFGLVWYGAPEAVFADPYLASLGADAASLSWGEFLRSLRSRRGMVKPLLLRQDVMAGIGNILADESLWHARIHPQARVSDLGDGALGRLYAGLRLTIRAVLASGGTSIRTFRHPDGKAGRYQERRLVYGKAGKPCPRCRAILQRIIVGGRGTTICPRCQQE